MNSLLLLQMPDFSSAEVWISLLTLTFLEIVLEIWVGYEIGRWVDWNTMELLFLGADLAIFPTTLIVKALNGPKF